MYLPYKHKHVTDQEHFYVITCISNFARFKSRYELYHRFKKHMEEHNVKLLTVELALGNRSFEVTEKGNPLHVQLRTENELWYKENLVNIGNSRLPPDAQYVAWVDADVQFQRPDWVEETIHQLQRYQLVQMFSHAIDMGPNGEPLEIHRGFIDSWMNNVQIPEYADSSNNKNKDARREEKNYLEVLATGKGSLWHPGFAWAANRSAIDALGGLFEDAILGSSDHHMAWALVGEVHRSEPEYLSAGYRAALHEWQLRAEKHIKRDIGVVSGSILHNWHGPKAKRYYKERWSIIKDFDFDPRLDLKKDSQGLLQFTDRGERMRNQIRNYFNVRNEDSIDNV